MSTQLNILALLGGSGSGKTFIKEILLGYSGLVTKKNSRCNSIYFTAPLQVTTRDRRFMEPSDSYLFVDSDYYSQLNMDNKLTAITFFDENEYGTLVKDFIIGDNIYNIVVVSLEGLESLKNSIRDNKFGVKTNLETALVLSVPSDDLINEHCRSIDFFKDEVFSLIQQPYDYYIPNYEEERADRDKLFEIFNLRLAD